MENSFSRCTSERVLFFRYFTRFRIMRSVSQLPHESSREVDSLVRSTY